MKQENLSKNITKASIDQDIKNLFHQSVRDINLTEQSKNKLYNVLSNIETQTPLRRFLEREIIIPMPSLAIFTSVAILLIGIYIGDIMIIKDIPNSKYEIINMQYLDHTASINQIKR